MLESGRDVARAGGAGARRGREARRCGAGDGVAWCPAVSHAIPSEYLASSYRFVYLSHSCLGIACDFGVVMVWERVGWGCDAGVWWGAWRGRVMGHMARGVARGMWRWGEVRGRADDRVKGFLCST